MTRSELLEAASAKIGRQIRPTTLQYAQLVREVDMGQKLHDGWCRYTDRHLQQLISYCNKRSHRVRRQAAQS